MGISLSKTLSDGMMPKEYGMSYLVGFFKAALRGKVPQKEERKTAKDFAERTRAKHLKRKLGKG